MSISASPYLIQVAAENPAQMGTSPVPRKVRVSRNLCPGVLVSSVSVMVLAPSNTLIQPK
jgi:hypothetical protein